jgi:hypothetical protein
MILLDTTNAMETTFTLKDVIYICTILITVGSAWFKLILNHNKSENAIATLEKELSGHKIQDKADKKEFFEKYSEYKIHSSNGRKAEKKEIIDMIEKTIKIAHDRIDKFKEENNKAYDKLEGRIDHLEEKMNDSTAKILEAIKSTKK